MNYVTVTVTKDTYNIVESLSKEWNLSKSKVLSKLASFAKSNFLDDKTVGNVSHFKRSTYNNEDKKLLINFKTKDLEDLYENLI